MQTGAPSHLFRGCAGSRRGRTPSRSAARSRGTPYGCSHPASAGQQAGRRGRAGGGVRAQLGASRRQEAVQASSLRSPFIQPRHTNSPAPNNCLPGCVSGRLGSAWCCCSATACRHPARRGAAPPAPPPTAASAHRRLAREPHPHTASRSGARTPRRLLPAQPLAPPRQLLRPLPLRHLLAPPCSLPPLAQQAPGPALAAGAVLRHRRAAGSSA